MNNNNATEAANGQPANGTFDLLAAYNNQNQLIIDLREQNQKLGDQLITMNEQLKNQNEQLKEQGVRASTQIEHMQKQETLMQERFNTSMNENSALKTELSELNQKMASMLSEMNLDGKTLGRKGGAKHKPTTAMKIAQTNVPFSEKTDHVQPAVAAKKTKGDITSEDNAASEITAFDGTEKNMINMPSTSSPTKWSDEVEAVQIFNDSFDESEFQDNTNNKGNFDNGANFSHKKVKITSDKNAMPVIVKTGIDGKGALRETIKRNLNFNDFFFENSGNVHMRIKPISVDARAALCNLLKARGYNFHSFVAPDERQYAVIIRGLTDDIDECDIKEALTLAGCPPLTGSICRFETGFTRAKKTSTGLWRVCFDKNITLTSLQLVTGINHCRCRFELAKKNSLHNATTARVFTTLQNTATMTENASYVEKTIHREYANAPRQPIFHRSVQTVRDRIRPTTWLNAPFSKEKSCPKSNQKRVTMLRKQPIKLSHRQPSPNNRLGSLRHQMQRIQFLLHQQRTQHQAMAKSLN